jgi:transmembrane sensor
MRPVGRKGMAGTTNPQEGAMPDRASDWLIALNEQPDDAALRDRFERWLAASPDHRRDWDEIGRTAQVLGHAQPLHRQEWGEFVSKRKAERMAARSRAESIGRVRRRRWLPAGVAALAAAACLIFFFGGTVLLRLEADHVTATAERRSLQLADGTTVLLGPESAIAVAYDRTARRVRLLKGEAFFEVAADSRPFGVEARDVEVRDIGTAFDVGLGARTTDVAVRDGIVEVTAPRAGVVLAERLGAGDWVRIRPSGGVERGQMAPDQVGSWTQGQLVVKNRSVAEVVDALRPYFDGLVVLRGATLEGQPLTGVYNLADPVEALRAVARAQGATLHRLSPWLIVISGD